MTASELARAPRRWSEEQRDRRRPPTRSARGPADTVDGDFVVRFDRTERLVHWLTAALMLVLAVTGLVLYVGPLSTLVNRRELVKEVHVLAGLALAVPLAVGLAGPWRAGLRRDIGRFAQWHDDDLRWFRRRYRAEAETGKFNGGQKANAIFIGAVIVVMLGTGSIMKWFGPFPLSFRTGATFVHDWTALALWFLIPAHIVKALITRGAVRAMWTGWTSRSEAESRPRWELRGGRR